MTSATDNRTTELLPCPCCDSESIKELAPDEWGDSANPYWKIKCMECGLTMCGTNRRMNQEAWNTRTPDQAIAATLGKPMGKDLRWALDSMRIWISDDAHLGESEFSYELEKAEGLRKLEAIEQAIAATLGGGTLTAEQVENAIRNCSTYASYDGCTYYASGIRLQAIADELNADRMKELGIGVYE